MVKAKLESGIILDKYNAIRDCILNKTDCAIHVTAYEGEHEDMFAGGEFAGKFIDICVKFYLYTQDKTFLDKAAAVVGSVIKNQRTDGYIGGLPKGKEWLNFTVWNQAFTVYGLCSYYEVTNDKKALSAAEKCIEFIDEYFMNGGDLFDCLNDGSQHCSILLSAVKLYKITGKKTHGDFVKYILKEIRKSDNNFFGFKSVFDLRSKKGIENFIILLGMLECGDFCDDAVLACERYWDELYRTQIREPGNGTNKEFWVPDGNKPQFLSIDIKPNETCVAVGWIEFSAELFKKTGKAKYIDAIEKTLYNHILGSINSDGSDFAYYQPNFGKRITETDEKMYKCCRYRGYSLFSQIPFNLYCEDDSFITPFLYTNSVYEGDGLSIKQKTNYPFDDTVSFEISGTTDKKLKLRIPKWSGDINVSGTNTWRDGDYLICELKGASKISVGFDFSPILHDASIDNTKYAYVTYGPVLLSLDSGLNKNLYDMTIEPKTVFKRTDKPNYKLCFEGPDNLFLVDYQSAGKAVKDSEYVYYIKMQ